MNLRLTAEILEDGDDRLGPVGAGEYPHRGLSSPQVPAESLALSGIESKALVVHRPEHAARHEPRDEARRRRHREDQPDAGSLARAPGACLVGLQLAVLVEDEDADGVEP